MFVHGYEIDENKLPRHIGIIMDGNRRWAKINEKNKLDGHKQGVKALQETLNFAYDILHLEIISLYSFSTENWERTKTEVNFLMRLFSLFYKNEFKEIVNKEVKVLHSGLKHGLSNNTLNILDKMQEQTKNFKQGIINLAFNYGGRQEIICGIKKVIQDFEQGKLNPDDLDANYFKNYLFNPDLPDPDLIIRTSGERRLSNFLLWQSAYSELYFTDILWPDFGPKHLACAIFDYQQRDRRFGG